MLYEILSDDQVTRFEQTLELDFSYALPRRARFRVNLYRDRGAVAAAFRLISSRIPTARELNLPPILEQLTERPRGLILVTGPTGSGKSTTMKALLGLVAPTSGQCSIFGKDSLKVDSRNEVGFLPENPYFYKHLSGRETLEFYGKLCGIRGATLKGRVAELLELVDLAGASHRRIGGYSKGMLQRIGLAQALIQNPRLVILDEPTAGVDPIGSREIRDLIFKLREQGITVFLCSHLLEQVQEVCDHVGIIFRGEIVKEGRLEDLIAIEDQTELILKDADPALIAEIEALIARDAMAKLVRTGKPRTTLERLFLRETKKQETLSK
jgi:ABC-2 type transport system ATP-binding protein